MSEVSVIGLGATGAALAQARIEAGHGVTVFNRTPQKTEPLAALGATRAQSAVDAVQAGPLIMVCIANCTATRQLLGADAVTPSCLATGRSEPRPMRPRFETTWRRCTPQCSRRSARARPSSRCSEVRLDAYRDWRDHDAHLPLNIKGMYNQVVLHRRGN